MFLLDLFGCCFYYFCCLGSYKKPPKNIDEEIESEPLLPDKFKCNEKNNHLSTKEILELLNDQEHEDNYQKMTNNFFTILPNGKVIYSEKKEKIIEYF